MSHVELSTEDVVDGEHLYHMYTEEGGNSSKHEFSSILRTSYPSVNIKRGWSKYARRTGACYHGIKLQDKNSQQEQNNFSSFSQYLPNNFFVTNSTEFEYHAAMFCTQSVNGNKILKEVVFRVNGKWSLEVAGKPVDLEKNKIDNSFNYTSNSIRTICEIVNKIRLCNGINKSCYESLEHNNYFLHEKWSDFDKPAINTYRSLQCSRIVPLTSLGSVCVKCRYCLYFHSNKKRESQKTVELSEDDSKEFEKILNEVMPNADKNLISLIQSQKENLSCNPRQRRWNKDILRLCLTIWSRIKKGMIK